MSTLKTLQLLLPQPGEDLKSWARALTAQLQMMLPLLTETIDAAAGGGSSTATAPLYQSDGTTEVITATGQFKLPGGTVIVDADGLHVFDALGFEVINGPTIRIDTAHIVDAAVETAKLAAGAVTTTTIAPDAVTTPKLAAGAVVAGKIAANAIVAGDAVIANGAIVDAQIANLNAAKINAGDIAAARMSTNIVTALTGKFATLSALAASLGVVQIQSGGALLAGSATGYATGTGLFADATQFRLGNPTGARIQWSGTALEVYNASNQLTISSGVVDWEKIGGANKPASNATVGATWGANISGQPSDAQLLNSLEENGATHITHPSGGSYGTTVTSVTGALQITLPRGFTNTMLRFYIEVYEYASGKSCTYEVGGYTYAATQQWFNTYAKMVGDPSAAKTVRFGHNGLKCCVWIGEAGSTWAVPQVRVTSLTAAYSNYAASAWESGWEISFTAGGALNVSSTISEVYAGGKFSGLDQITSGNISNYFSSAAIGTAYITDAAITNAKIDRVSANRLQVVSADIVDANITNAKLGDASVTTLKIGTNAVTIPVIAEYPTAFYFYGTKPAGVYEEIAAEKQITLTESTSVIAVYSGDAYARTVNVSAANSAEIRLYLNGTYQYTLCSEVNDGSDSSAQLYSAAHIFTLGAGTHTVSIRAYTYAGSSGKYREIRLGQQRSLILLGAQR